MSGILDTVLTTNCHSIVYEVWASMYLINTSTKHKTSVHIVSLDGESSVCGSSRSGSGSSRGGWVLSDSIPEGSHVCSRCKLMPDRKLNKLVSREEIEKWIAFTGEYPRCIDDEKC